MSEPKFVPKTVYVIYIASTPEEVWEALTSAEFVRKYFFGRSVEIEPKVGGSFILRMPDGRVDSQGKVVDWNPPRRLSVTWHVEWMEEFRNLPECRMTYDIESMGESVKLTMTEAHQWDIPDAILAGGRQGWPFILSSLKSVLETGKPLVVSVPGAGLPIGMMEALKEVGAKKPWRDAGVAQ